MIAQIAFAGYGAFYSADKVADAAIDEDTFDDGWGLHVGFGYLVFLMTLIAVDPGPPGTTREAHGPDDGRGPWRS